MKVGTFILRRSIFGLIAFILIILMYSAILNTQLEVIMRARIGEASRIAMTSPKMREEMYGKTLEEIHEMRKEIERSMLSSYGLDKPIYVRIFTRAFKAVCFDFGDSRGLQTIKKSRRVKDIIMEALPNTVILFVTTTIISVFLAIIVGILKAKYVNSWFDRITSIITMFFYGMPSWIIGSFLVLFFVYYLKILPFGSLYSVPPPEGPLLLFIDRLKHMSIPLMSVVLVRFWPNAFMIKNIVLEPLQQDFITAARGRGLPEHRVMFGHALRTASPAIVTMSLLSIIMAFSGDIVLEQVLAWPGLGLLLWKAISINDLPVMMGVLTSLTLIFVVALILLDLIYAFLDPRIQYT